MKYTVALAAIAAFLLVGCSQSATTDFGDPFIGGTQGLGISFEAGAPPTEVFDGGQYPFSVIVKLQNLGESDVGPDSVNSDNHFGYVQLIGINPTQFNYPETEKLFSQEDFTLGGARRNFDGTIVAGDTNVLTFENFNYLPDERGNSQVTMRANVCYDYETYSNTRVCIKDNVLENIADDSICVLAGPKDAKNSGAPVHVTQISQNPLGRDKIQVTFTIENVGTGQVFRRSTDQLGGGAFGNAGPCDTSPTNPNRNYVGVEVYLGDQAQTSLISCPLLGNSNEGYINLFQGSAVTMSCTILTNPQGNRVYTDTMHINLKYTYNEFVETPILIRDVSTGGANR